MRFIIDAQLPKRLSDFFNEIGHDSVHTLDLPNKNLSTDIYISKLADEQKRIVITKDIDFLESFLVKKQPQQLILVKTGNINNDELLNLFANNLHLLIDLFKTNCFIEITKNEIITHQ